MNRPPRFLRLKALLLSLGALLASAAATAQAAPQAAQPVPLPRSYAVISEVAREVSVVAFQETLGSRLNKNERQRLPVPDGAFDKVALVTAQQALKLAAPVAGVWLIAPAETDFFGNSLQVVAPGDTVKMPADLAAAFKDNRTSHLMLFSRHRAEARFRFVEMTDSTGLLEGMGLYVDRLLKVKNLDTRDTGIGFLGPYVYLRATLIDTATSKVISTQITQATRVFSAGEAKDGSGNPWEALSAAEKMATLRDMLRDEVARLVPLLLAGT